MHILDNFGIGESIRSLVSSAEAELDGVFRNVEETAEYNQYKVIDAFRQENISPRHFNPSNGYGYSDESREALCRVFARITKAGKSLLSPHIASGTHAISLALFSLLRPGDTMISVTGRPYDTLTSVIGDRKEKDIGSLADFGVEYKQIDLLADGTIDVNKVINTVRHTERPKLLFMQRSRGYAWRKALSMKEIKEFTGSIRRVFPEIIIMADNCYGEFCETEEPIECGVDIIAGSMIKNPGGGIAPTGGYAAGRPDLIELAENRLTCPGLGAEVGSYEATYRPFFQGLFMAPHITAEALKGSILSAKVFEMLGYKVYPAYDDQRSDITQSIMLEDEDLLLAYTKGIQKAAAVDSHATPVPWDMPGYEDKIVMAAGTFVQGASIELSADAPVKPPYIVYAQGGLTYAHMKLGLMCALDEMGII